MDKSKGALVSVALSILAVAIPAHAYVGPGAGLSLLGALWALLAAIAAALIFIVAWPIRRMRRRKREAAASETRRQAFEAEKGRPEEPDTRSRKTADRDADADRLQTQ